jgi:hypothetical protein
VIEKPQAIPERSRGFSITVLAAVVILVLAGGALLWPGDGPSRNRGVFLVFDSTGDGVRTTGVYEPLRQFLSEFTRRPLELEIAATVATFTQAQAAGVDFVLCPDGLSLDLPADGFLPVAVGRRAAPRNLRPRGVLVYRKAAGLVADPWLSRPEATVCGDSVSLTVTGNWRRRGQPDTSAAPARGTCAWGPDPYDHAPVLHALRLGGFDYALVRQWDADRFFSDGLLSPQQWGLELMTIPVPDVVVLAARSVNGQTRLAVSEGLAGLGRDSQGESPLAGAAHRGLGRLNLAGFNLLVEPDWELVRRNFAAGWPPAPD